MCLNSVCPGQAFADDAWWVIERMQRAIDAGRQPAPRSKITRELEAFATMTAKLSPEARELIEIEVLRLLGHGIQAIDPAVWDAPAAAVQLSRVTDFLRLRDQLMESAVWLFTEHGVPLTERTLTRFYELTVPEEWGWEPRRLARDTRKN